MRSWPDLDVSNITLQWSGAMSRPTVVRQSKNEWQPPVFVRLVPLYVKSLCKASINLKLQYPNPLPGWAFEYKNFGLFKFLLSTPPPPPPPTFLVELKGSSDNLTNNLHRCWRINCYFCNIINKSFPQREPTKTISEKKDIKDCPHPLIC